MRSCYLCPSDRLIHILDLASGRREMEETTAGGTWHTLALVDIVHLTMLLLMVLHWDRCSLLRCHGLKNVTWIVTSELK
jgi:hypothetical protein